MKLLLFAAGLLCLMGVARGSDDEQLVREVVKSFVTDYNNGDFKNAPSYTTDHWVHINPGGGLTRGRDEVLEEVRAIHKTMLKGVSITIDSMTVHFVTRDVVLVNAIHKSDSYVTPATGSFRFHGRGRRAVSFLAKQQTEERKQTEEVNL